MKSASVLFFVSLPLTPYILFPSALMHLKRMLYNLKETAFLAYKMYNFHKEN